MLVWSACAADDPGGWTAAKWGMTIDQVRAAVPDAQILTGNEPKRTINGVLSPLGVPSLEIGKVTWSVYFLFDQQGHLSAVEINTDTPSVEAYIQTAQLLTERYGHPAEETAGGRRSAQWTFATTTIQLRYTYLAAIQMETLWLSYTRPNAARI